LAPVLKETRIQKKTKTEKLHLLELKKHVWLHNLLRYAVGQRIWAALTYLARRYDLAVCCSKMSHDAFLSDEVLYEADKALEKFA